MLNCYDLVVCKVSGKNCSFLFAFWILWWLGIFLLLEFFIGLVRIIRNCAIIINDTTKNNLQFHQIIELENSLKRLLMKTLTALRAAPAATIPESKVILYFVWVEEYFSFQHPSGMGRSFIVAGGPKSLAYFWVRNLLFQITNFEQKWSEKHCENCLINEIRFEN